MHGCKRRLARRQAGFPPDGHIHAKMGQDLMLLSTSSLVGAPTPSPSPGCSMPSPAPSAPASCEGKVAQVFICCLRKYLLFDAS